MSRHHIIETEKITLRWIDFAIGCCLCCNLFVQITIKTHVPTVEMIIELFISFVVGRKAVVLLLMKSRIHDQTNSLFCCFFVGMLICVFDLT